MSETPFHIPEDMHPADLALQPVGSLIGLFTAGNLVEKEEPTDLLPDFPPEQPNDDSVYPMNSSGQPT